MKRLDKLAGLLNHEMEILELEKKLACAFANRWKEPEGIIYLNRSRPFKELGDRDDRTAGLRNIGKKL